MENKQRYGHYVTGKYMENKQRYGQYVTVYEMPNICSGVAGQHSTFEVKASTVFEFLKKCESLKSTVHWLDATLVAVCHYGIPAALKSLCVDEADTILHAVVRFALTTERLSLLHEILNLNIQTEERNGIGDTVFHTVTKFRPVPDPKVLKMISELLLKKGFNVASRNSEGKLPVEYLDRSCPGFVYDIFFKAADPDKIIGDIYSFKLKGNELFMAGNAYAALDYYSNAIELLNSMTSGLAMQKMGSHEIAVLYGNRAECFLKLRFYQQAHDDALQSVSIDGHWYKAHIRVGKALKGLKDFMKSVQAFCNAYLCPITEDKVKVEILVELAPVLQTLNFHGRLDKIPIENGHIWAQACYHWLSKNDWDTASAAFNQYEQSKCKQPHLALTLKPFCYISKLKVHGWCLGLMQYLLDCGADKKTISLEDGDTYLHAVVKITLVVGKSMELLKYLLNRFCRTGYSDQHRVDRSGNTVLHTATLQRNADKKKRQTVIEMLLKTTVDASIRNQSGKVALDYLPSEEPQSRELLRMAMFNRGKTLSTIGDDEESKGSTKASKSAEEKQPKQKSRRKDPCDLCEDLYKQAAAILQEEKVIEGFDKLTQILAEQHSGSRHEGIVNKTISSIVKTLSQMQNLEHMNSLLCIPMDYIIMIVERLATEGLWKQLDMLVRKYRNKHGKDKLKAFGTNLTVVPVINEPSLAQNEDLKLQIVLNLLNSNASLGSDEGVSAMKSAVDAEHYRVLHELIKRGADTRALSVIPGDTPIHAAVQIALGKDKSLTILEHLLTQYASKREGNEHLDPEQQDKNGDCLFHLVAKAKNSSQAVKVTETLCNRRISGNYVNKDGKLPQDYIMKHNDRRLQFLRLAKSVQPTNKQMFNPKKTATQTTPLEKDLNKCTRPADSEADSPAVAQHITKIISARETRMEKIRSLIRLLPDSSNSVFSAVEVVKEVDVNDVTQTSNGASLQINPPENEVKENAAGLDSDSESDESYMSASEVPEEVFCDVENVMVDVKPASDKHIAIDRIDVSDEEKPGKAVVYELVVDGSGDHTKASAIQNCLKTASIANEVDIQINVEKWEQPVTMEKGMETNNTDNKEIEDLVDGPPENADDIVEIVEDKEDSGDDADDDEFFVVDAQVFDNLEWEVECTAEVWKTLRDKRVPPDLKRRIVHKIQLLASGDWQPHLCKKLIHVLPTLNLFEAKFSKGQRIIWELAVAFSPRLSETAERRLHSEEGGIIQPVRGGNIYSEIIRVWDIVMDHKKIYRSVQRINKSHLRGEQCIIQKNLRGMRVDQTTQTGVGKRYPMLYAEDDVTKEELFEQNKEIQKYFPPASSNDTEYHILKFYSFSSALVSHVLQNIETKVDFPFRVTDLEHAFINLKSKAPILLLGRSGTGKTTCCMYRLWSQFQTYWSKAKDAGAPILPRCVEFVHDEPIEEDNSNEEGESSDNSDDGTEDTGATGGPLPEAVVCTTPEEPHEEVETMYDHLHQLFITKNAVLCSEVQKNFRELSHANELMADYMQHEDENLPPRLQDVEDYAFPMFVTSRQLLLMLDASVGPPFFFERKDDGSLKVDISGWTDAGGPLSILSLLDDDSDAEEDMDEFEDSDHEMEMGDNWNTESSGKATKVDPRREITYTVFVEEIWRHTKKNTSSYHPSLIWTEIMSFIKGSYEALSKLKGYLDKEEYFELGRKRAPNFSGERDVIYSFFLKYEHFRKQHALFDETDLVHDVFQRLRQLESRPWVIHQIFVDETQDFTQAELCLLIRLCQNPNDMFLTGDTAQSIMRGISFRFSDLRSLFYHAKQSMQAMGKTSAVEVPKQVYQLTHNYRSHAGILSLATSILELMVEFFPDSFDRLRPDQGLFNGPRPILLESCSFGDLAVLLRGNRRKTSHIEFGAHQAILVVNDAARDSIPEELRLGLILTIYEAKGLEFDDVLLYNFFKDSQASKEWRVVTDYLDRLVMVQNESAIVSSGNLVTLDQEILESSTRPRPLKFDSNQHKVLNSELKHLYTALTRARVNVWIFDEDRENRAPMFEYFKARKLVKHLEVQEINETSLSETVFAEKSSPADWLRRGEDFMRHSLYTVAAKCFGMGGDHEREKVALAHGQALLASRLKDKPRQMRDEFLHAAELYLECNKPPKAALCLQNAKERGLAAELFEKLGQYDRAADIYKKMKLPLDSSRCYEQNGNFNEAIKVLCDNENFDMAIDTLRRYSLKIKDLEQRGLPIPISLNDYRPDAAYTEERLSHRAANLYHKYKKEDKMMEAVEKFKDTNDRVQFLKDRNYINQAAEMLANSGNIEEAAEMLFTYGKRDKAVLMAKRTEDEAVIGKFLLMKCRSLLYDSNKQSTELGESNLILKDAILETIEMFEACNDFDGLGAAWMLNWVLSENTQCIEKALQSFRKSKPFENTAGIVECAHLLVQTQNLNLENLEICIRSIHDLFNVCFALLFPNSTQNFDRLLKFDSFYGFKPCSSEKYAVHPKERPRCLEMIPDLISSKAGKKMQVIEVFKKEARVSLAVVLLKRIQQWLEPIFARIQTLRDEAMVCDWFRLGLPCTLGKNCRKLHRLQTNDDFGMLIGLDVLCIECESHVQSGASSLIEKKCPEAVTSIVEVFVTNKVDNFYERYKGCFCLWHDLMPVDGHPNLIGNESKKLMEYISGNKVRKQLKEFLLGQWKQAEACDKGMLLNSQAVRESEVFMRMEFGYYLFRFTTGKHQFETSPSSKMRQLELQLDGEIAKKGKRFNQTYYTVMVSPHNNTMNVECTARRFIDSFDELLKGDVWESVEKFTKFIILSSKKDVDVLEPWVFIMWLEFYSTLASLIIAKLKIQHFADFLFVLPNNYFNLMFFVESSIPSGLKIIEAIQRFQTSYRNNPKMISRMQERLKCMAFAVAGFCDHLPLMETLVKKSVDNPMMFGVVERLLILAMTLVCNIGKTVEVVNEQSLMNMMTKVKLEDNAPLRLRRILERLQNATGIADVANVLKDLLNYRQRSELLLVCSWKTENKMVLLAKSAIKTSAEIREIFDDQFLNADKTLNAMQQNKEGCVSVNEEHVVKMDYQQETDFEEDQTKEEIEKSQREKQEQQLRDTRERAVTTISRWYRKIRDKRNAKKDKDTSFDPSFAGIKVDNKSCGICGVYFEQLVTSIHDGNSKENAMLQVRKEHMATLDHQRNSQELMKFKKTYQEFIEPKLKDVKTFLYDSGFGLVDQSYVEKHYAQHQMDIQRLPTLVAHIEKELQLKINSRMWKHEGLVDMKLKELENNFRTLKPYIEQIHDKLRQEKEEMAKQTAASNIPRTENWEDEIEDIQVVVEEPKIEPRKGRANKKSKRKR
ncbi:TPR and ankyrin repeat-containing protein 1-like isoform X2 [Dreissena polymorpha]|uniref:TPR and ankyrin repeat-containing protein 1-like isoform X2 n=1 Tax=Dreissena polymorpha TaxID=45954 RepID=UPI0022648532|nr:TPR and ankyrin repeat-containing protein 1-like isoform X2 [Dreissena polymorpha]